MCETYLTYFTSFYKSLNTVSFSIHISGYLKYICSVLLQEWNLSRSEERRLREWWGINWFLERLTEAGVAAERGDCWSTLLVCGAESFMYYEQWMLDTIQGGIYEFQLHPPPTCNIHVFFLLCCATLVKNSTFQAHSVQSLLTLSGIIVEVVVFSNVELKVFLYQMLCLTHFQTWE